MNNPREDGFMVMGEYILRIERDEPSEEFKQLAAKELRETPDVRDVSLSMLRERIRGDESIYIPIETDEFLLSLLRACKFYPDTAFDKIKKFCDFKLKNPKLCNGLLPSSERNGLEQGFVTIVPRRDRHGRRVFILQSGENWDISQCNVYEMLRATMITTMSLQAEPHTQIAGGAVIVDVKGLTMNHVLQFTPSLTRKLIYCMENCFAVRLKTIHVVNQSYFLNMAFALFKPFLGEKLRKRIHFHGEEREKLLEDIGAKYLPIKYGGEMDLPEIPGSKYFDLLCHYEDEYEKLLKVGYTNKHKAHTTQDSSDEDSLSDTLDI